MDEATLDKVILAYMDEDEREPPTDDEVFAGIDFDLSLDAVPVTEVDHLNWLIENELRMETFTP